MDNEPVEIKPELAPIPVKAIEVAPERKGREHSFRPVLLASGAAAGKLSEREAVFLTVLLKTGSIAIASQEIGISRVSGWRYTKRPHIKKYLDRLRLRAAKAADLTADKVAAVIGDAIEGDTTITPLQLQAAGMAARMLAPARGPSVVVNSQVNNNNFSGPSPFADLAPAAMIDEIKKNLLEMGDGAP